MTQAFAPTTEELINRARADLRMGVPVVLCGHQGDAIVMSAETAGSERLAGLRALGGAPVLAITGRRAKTLKARAYDGDLARLPLPRGADCEWIRAVADPKDDLRAPMKGPFFTRREGDPALYRLAISLVKSAQLLPAALVLERRIDGSPDLAMLTRLNTDKAGPLLLRGGVPHPVVSARLPTKLAQGSKLHIFRPDDGGVEHYALEIGVADRGQPALTRMHSACFTGDVLGSLKCDCGPQLNSAMAQIGQEGAGVLLYLNQEGRGIGLANKMRAYSLQDQGFDTVEANHRLGFEDDERDFRIGGDILRHLGFVSVRLLTNNPRKIAMMKMAGIQVTERVPLKVGLTDQNAAYLATKAKKSGHLL